MRETKSQYIGLRLNEEDRVLLEQYAKDNFGGNMSKAIRHLVNKFYEILFPGTQSDGQNNRVKE